MELAMGVPIAMLDGAMILASDQGIAAGQRKRQPFC
jgi:hypothetical protein